MTPAKCFQNKFSVHERSDCEHWNVLGTPSFRFKIGTHLSLRSMTYCVMCIHCATCEVILTCTLRADSGLPRPLRTCSRFHIVQTSFRRLRGRFAPRTCFDRVPAGTVLAGTRLFRTPSDYKKWCVPRTCSRWNCTENKCERPGKCLSKEVCFDAQCIYGIGL